MRLEKEKEKEKEKRKITKKKERLLPALLAERSG